MDSTDSSGIDLKAPGERLPPTPPESTIEDHESTASDEPEFPLPRPRKPAVEVLDVDKSTPDRHVPRDARLIRLTGVHPFNVEAPLSALFDEGFLTSPELFYVRNHGAVPHIQDHEVLDWTFSVEGYAL
jgi:nitrate reductase (NAD(P)H)